MSVSSGPQAWSEFWKDEGPAGRCVAPSSDDVAALDHEWAHFAAGLPIGAVVVDLGCGTGIVGRILLERRSDIQVVGVDAAHLSARGQERLKIMTSVPMEALPFDDHSFNAAVSQFGIEYGKISDTGAELKRVLKPGAQFCFFVHHRESGIVSEGCLRRRALRAVTSGPFKKAFLSGRVKELEQQTRQLMSQYSSEPRVKLVSNHFRQKISCTRAERHALLKVVADAAALELCLLAQLERSAMSADQLGQWLVPLLLRMSEIQVSVIRRRPDQPIAWKIHGRR